MTLLAHVSNKISQDRLQERLCRTVRLPVGQVDKRLNRYSTALFYKIYTYLYHWNWPYEWDFSLGSPFADRNYDGLVIFITTVRSDEPGIDDCTQLVIKYSQTKEVVSNIRVFEYACRFSSRLGARRFVLDMWIRGARFYVCDGSAGRLASSGGSVNR